MTEHVTRPPQPATPFADAVLRLRQERGHCDQIVSFHALPWSQGRSLKDAGMLSEKYRLLFGEDYLASEVAYSGVALDSFFRPTGCLDLAQQYAAEAFDADQTFFVTCGTTVANSVAFDALAQPGSRILVDRTSHQSVHMVAGRSQALISYTPCAGGADASGQPMLDVDGMVAMIVEAQAAGRPYDVVVLAAASYEGLLYDLHSIMSACLEASPQIAFLIDEAWAAINAFHPSLRPLTAIDAARRIQRSGTPVNALVTQSAHKSMSAARQGSYLHVVGEPSLIGRVRSSLYGRHTTSPSIPILASLDLARAHAEYQGAMLVQRAIDLAEAIHRAVAQDPALAAYRTSRCGAGAPQQRTYFASDPTKVLIDVDGIGLRGDEARGRLFDDYGIYVSRTLARGFLVNLHIGVTQADVSRLLDALSSLARRELARSHCVQESTECRPGDLVDHIVIAYPPGVPLAVPGETWTEQLAAQLDDSRRCGIDVYSLPVCTTANLPTPSLN